VIRWCVVVSMMVVAMSCFVDRRSGEFECDDDTDCADIEGPDRRCNEGYCILATCPSICDGGCTTGKMCTINCSSPNECRTGIACPAGFNCIFNCGADCTPVSCPLGCAVNCSAVTSDCGPINCGTGATCTCSGPGTCL
jgi:hypothetical protein